MEFTDKFKADFKYYKKKCPPPDYSRVIDFSKLSEESPVKRLKPTQAEQFIKLKLEEMFIPDLMTPPSEWDIFELVHNPGLIFIRNPFKMIGQRYWIFRCLKDFTRQPNRLNIDAHDILEKSQNWWDACHSDDQHLNALKKKLRWATIGYHHDWNSKVYCEKMKDPFPTDLGALSQYLNWVVGNTDGFSAEAAIVNFYHFDSTLSGHTDHSEKDMSAPLFSYSFGQTAIFLLGGTTLDVSPTAIYIRSGDVVIMSKYSRQCYHGIPKILPANESPWNVSWSNPSVEFRNEDLDLRLDENASSTPEKIRCKSNQQELFLNLLDDSFWKPFEEYIVESRINMNVRQVLCKGETMLQNDIK